MEKKSTKIAYFVALGIFVVLLVILGITYKDAPIIVLDEATAFTDPDNEDKIQRSINELSRGKTLLVIAHRLSTITGADNIVVLDDGCIAAQGTHSDLLESSVLYRSMWEAHTGASTWIGRHSSPEITQKGKEAFHA